MPTAEPIQKCICQICTCGRHRCPHRPGTTFQFGSNGGDQSNLLSEYNERYKDNEHVKRTALRRARDNLEVGTDRLEDATTTRADYVAQKAQRPVPIRNVDNLKPEGDHDLTTNYKREFDAKQISRATPPRTPRRDNLGNSTAKFEGQPSYRDDYRTWAIGKPERLRLADELSIPVEPFDGSTTQRSSYVDQKPERQGHARPRTITKLTGDFADSTTSRNDYQGRPGERTTMRKPDDSMKLTGDMDMTTTTKQDYKEAQDLATRIKANRPQTVTKLDGEFYGDTTTRNTYKGLAGERARNFKPTSSFQSTEPFDGYTTQRMDYTEKVGSRTKANRPQTATKISGDFVKETTTNSDYQPWSVQKPEFRRSEENLRPEGTMDLNTIMKTDYGNYKRDRFVAPVRPQTSQKNVGDMDTTTTHKQDYPGWKVENRPVGAPKQEYKPPSGKFEGQSTNKLDFVTLPLDRTKPIRQSGVSLFDQGPMNGTTSYRSEYVPRVNSGPCPAEGLIGNGGGNDIFRFRNQIGGHHFYAPAAR